jgi:hypothetical protein
MAIAINKAPNCEVWKGTRLVEVISAHEQLMHTPL